MDLWSPWHRFDLDGVAEERAVESAFKVGGVLDRASILRSRQQRAVERDRATMSRPVAGGKPHSISRNEPGPDSERHSVRGTRRRRPLKAGGAVGPFRRKFLFLCPVITRWCALCLVPTHGPQRPGDHASSLRPPLRGSPLGAQREGRRAASRNRTRGGDHRALWTSTLEPKEMIGSLPSRDTAHDQSCSTGQACTSQSRAFSTGSGSMAALLDLCKRRGWRMTSRKCF